MPTRSLAQSRFAGWYYARVLETGQAFERLDADWLQISCAIGALMNAGSDDQARRFLDFLQALSPYLQARQVHRALRDYCAAGLRAAAHLGSNPGWLYLLRYQANWGLGEWQASLPDLDTAIRITRDVVPDVHAHAVFALGSAQLNQGNYRAALETLAEAERLLAALNDHAGVAACKGEIAAFYLNRSDYTEALARYQALAEYERRTVPGGPSDHTVFMLGVTYRRVKNYNLAIRALEGLIARSEERGNRGTAATASHHLAWTYLECGRLVEAERLGRSAQEWYDKVQDLRGSSDADEQLGALALARHDPAAAQPYLERSLSIRERIGNEHGAASSLRRLARCHLAQGHYRRGLVALRASLTRYHRMGMLSRRRVVRMVRELVGWS